ncbi:hypothetical protein DD681_02615 [Buchnera aphidicola (Melanaphis sacchari)]|uniref:Translocation/assembly module TamB n=1 Tax=Buchnera aphidicola (Melanaphis sacchari) TaxID=2173854 RepID=A0A2U8DGU5_9GAMM|nr:translocation/assembly module TamB [Buchnera aphidicola]AWH90675.1 hypothetical protein DD681_02615 [Buchnera aphidicola (Melanaphis sacchari)]
MAVYQRYLSKSLIFLSIFSFLILFFLEINIGFKWIFNITNYYFLGLKKEEISGNWRDFTLKNISYNFLNTSIQADSIHIIIDPMSLFRMTTIFKKIETKNLIIFLQKNKKNFSFKKDIFEPKKKFFFKKPIFFEKIYCDKILLKIKKSNIFFFNVHSSIKNFNNHLMIYPTNIYSIYFKSSNNYIKHFFYKKNVFNAKKVDDFKSFFSNFKNFFISKNITLKSVKCQKMKLFEKNSVNLSKIELNAKLKESVLKIKKIKFFSKYFELNSQGEIFYKKNSSISFFIKNKFFLKNFHNKFIQILLQGTINDIFTFKIKSRNSLFQFYTYGKIILNKENYPIYLNSKIYSFIFSLNKKFKIHMKDIMFSLKGTTSNYFFSIKNIFNISGTPSIFVKILGHGNLKKIFLKKIFFQPLIQDIKNKNLVCPKKNNLNKYLFRKKIDTIDHLHKKLHDFFKYYFNIPNNLIKRRISIFGLLNYQKFDEIKIPKISFLLGKNRGFLSGLISKRMNIFSSINFNNLDFFLPNLKGVITTTFNIYGLFYSPVFSGNLSGKNIRWNNVKLDNIKISTHINSPKKILNSINIDIKKLHFLSVNLNSFNFQGQWNHNTQNFNFFLKQNKDVSIRCILMGRNNYASGLWKGLLKKIYIKTYWGKWIIKDTSLAFFYKKNIVKNNNCKDDLYKIKNISSNIKNKINFFLKKCISQSLIKFKTDVFFNINFNWKLGKSISDMNFFLKGNNIELKRKIKDKIFTKRIDYLDFYLQLKKNTIITKWKINEFQKSLKNKIFGILNIRDIYNRKELQGKITFSNVQFSFLNFFINDIVKFDGLLKGNTYFLGDLYHPKIIANIHLNNIYIKSNNILKYMILFFRYIPKSIENVSTNQKILINQGNILFKLNFINDGKFSNVIWNAIFSSDKVAVSIIPKTIISFSSQLSLSYILSKYNLIGYLKFFFFVFKINEQDIYF